MAGKPEKHPHSLFPLRGVKFEDALRALWHTPPPKTKTKKDK
jgi:hypothetical protein